MTISVSNKLQFLSRLLRYQYVQSDLISAIISVLTVRKISFRNIRGTVFPSLASLATPYWKDYSDNIEIPALVLMENMNSEGSQVVFLSLRNLEKLLIPGDNNETMPGPSRKGSAPAKQVVNSQVIHLSFGDNSERVRINEPVTMVFRHKNVGNVTNPRCVLWDRRSESWSDKFCQVVATNSTHTRCECSRIGTFALLEEIEQTDAVARMTFLVMVIIAASVSIIAFISMVLMFVYCHRIKVFRTSIFDAVGKKMWLNHIINPKSSYIVTPAN